MVMGYWSVAILFWQLLIDHIVNVLYKRCGLAKTRLRHPFLPFDSLPYPTPTICRRLRSYVRSVNHETTKRKEVDHIPWVWGSVPCALRVRWSPAKNHHFVLNYLTVLVCGSVNIHHQPSPLPWIIVTYYQSYAYQYPLALVALISRRNQNFRRTAGPTFSAFHDWSNERSRLFSIRCKEDANITNIILLHENFCNLIGSEQWYVSLIWNTYMWKLQTFRG